MTDHPLLARLRNSLSDPTGTRMSEIKLNRSSSDPTESKRPIIVLSNHHEPVSPRGPMKSHVVKLKEDLQKEEMERDTDVESEPETSVPDPGKQQEIINSIDTECTCTYSMSKLWHRKWEEYVGISQNTESGGISEHPGPIEMDIHNEANNEYVHEDVWKHLVRWYGVSPNHQLDRKHLYFKDEKPFDICMLSPFSGIVEHAVKKFNRFEEIGYIECQMRRIFRVGDHKRSRLWISEKAQVPRFRQLLLRFRMLNDCIHRDKVYILALEECVGNDAWPTGEPGEAKGELFKYNEFISGRQPDDFWSQEIDSSLNTLTASVSDSIRQKAQAFFQDGQALLQEKESVLDKTNKILEAKIEETHAKEKFLDEKSKQIAKQEEILKQGHEALIQERQELEEKLAKFDAELKQMEAMHKIQETRIKLDIGGHTFTTSIQTLLKGEDSMLAAMFSGRYELKQESDGSYFIDRDGTYFRYILNFLRDSYIDARTLPNDIVVLREILREAKYFQLGGFVNFLEELISSNFNNSLNKHS